MFEEGASEEAGGWQPAMPDVDADGFPVEPALPPIPEDLLAQSNDPAWLALEDEWLREQEAEVAFERSMISPAERFEQEYGLSAVPEQYLALNASSADAAAAVQEIAVQLERVQRVAEAHRIAGLLQAYETSMADLRLRFESGISGRGGLGAQAFFKSMGLQTQTHPFTVARQVDAALILRDRLPKTWAAFQHGDASWARTETVAKEAEGLDGEHWGAYDEVAAKQVVTSTRLRDALRKARERLQDGTAGERAKTTYERRHTLLEIGNDGAAAFVVNGTAPDWVAFDQALHRAAVAAHGAERETRTLAQLKHDIVHDLLIEGIKQRSDEFWMALQVPKRPGVEVHLILTVPALAWLGKTAEQAQLEGCGPIDLETAKGLAGSAKSMLRVLTDPVTGVRLTMDRKVYSPPADLARWVRIRDGRSRFPGSNRPAHLADIDHAREWQHGGATDAVNLVTLDRSAHNLKSNGLFTEELRPDGTVEWEDAWGHSFPDPPFDPLDPAPSDLLPTPRSDPDPDPDPDRDEPAPF